MKIENGNGTNELITVSRAARQFRNFRLRKAFALPNRSQIIANNTHADGFTTMLRDNHPP